MRGRKFRPKSNTFKVSSKSHSCAPFICGDVYRVTEESEVEKIMIPAPETYNNVLGSYRDS